LGTDAVSFRGPPPPDGFVLDDHPEDAPAQDMPQDAAGDVPPPPPGFEADPVANEVSAPVQGGFADQLPVQPLSRLSTEDEATLQGLYRTADANTIKSFMASKGLAPTRSMEEYVAARDNALKTGQPFSTDITYAMPKAMETDAGTAFLDGASQGAFLGTSDEIHGFLNGVGALMDGKSYTQEYARTVDQDRAQLGADQQDHPYASFAGNLAGGIALPVGLAKTGLTAGMEAIALRAGQEAIASGATAEQAQLIAARAVTQRLATEGAAYGGAYGAGSADGDASQRLVGAATGAAAGAALPLGARALAPVVAPVLRGAVNGLNTVADGVRGVVGSITNEGAKDGAAGLLRGAVSGSTDDVLRSIESAAPPVSGARPTLAEVANDPGIAGFQRGQANTDLATASAIGDRNSENALIRTRAASEVMGRGEAQSAQDYAAQELAKAEGLTGAQRAMREAAINDRLRLETTQAQTARQAAETSVNDARSALGPVADRNATGSAAREAFDTAYSAAKTRSNEAYSAPILKAAQPINIGPDVAARLKQSADNFYGDGGGYIPGPLQEIINDAFAPGATTRTLTNIDRRLADFAGEARMAGRGQEAAFSDSFRRQLVDVAQREAPKEYRDALAAAKAVRADQGKRFETGDIAKAFARDQYRNPVVGDNTLPTRLARPGAAGGDTAEGLIAAIGPDASEGVIRQEIRRLADEGNVQTEAQARSLATKYNEAARRFPAVQSDLQALQQRAAGLDVARQGETSALRGGPTAEETASLKERSALHDQILSSPLGKLADPEVDPTAFVAGLIRRDDGGRRLKALAGQVQGNENAQNGLRRALGDFIVTAGTGPNNTASGSRIPSINKTREAISKVLTRGGDLLTPQQKLVLRAVGKELESANFAATMSKPAGSETALNRTFADMMEFVPATGPTTAAAKIINKVVKILGNGDEVKRLITQSILDPDFAATLLKRPTQKHWIEIQDNMLGRKATAASALITQPRLSAAVQSLPNRLAAQESQGNIAVANGNGGQQQPEQQGVYP